jgi:phage gpG-like protein
MSVIITGVRELKGALAAMVARQNAATLSGLTKSAHLLEREIKVQLSLNSHQADEPTTSAAGEPPALVSGDLRRSIQVEDATSLGGGRYSTEVGPTIVYGRIQELGGQTGRRHATTLPPRPYVAPALEKMQPVMREVMKAAWRAALRG